MLLQRNCLFLLLNTPQLDGLVITTRGQIPTVRRECDEIDFHAMPFQRSYFHLQLYTPQIYATIFIAKSQILAIRRECD
jgi:hypothetical protein